MPGLMTRELPDWGKLLLAFGALGAVWVGFQTGWLQALMALAVSSPTALGLIVLALFTYWAWDELEDDDDASDVISKTSNRAENATGGLLNSTAALVLGALAILGTVATQALDAGMAFVDVAVAMPFASVQLGTVGLGALGALGAIPVEWVIGGGLLLLGLGMITRDRDGGS